MDRRVLACGLVALLAIGGCGQSAEEEALAIATEVCETVDTGRRDGGSQEEYASRVSAAADRAGKAARLDSTWSPLARSVSDLHRAMESFADLMESMEGINSWEEPPAGTSEKARTVARELREATGDVDAECRKTTP